MPQHPLSIDGKRRLQSLNIAPQEHLAIPSSALNLKHQAQKLRSSELQAAANG